MEKLLNVREAAEFLSMSERFVRNNTSRRYTAKKNAPMIPFIRLGNRLRYRVADLEAYLTLHERGTSKNER